MHECPGCTSTHESGGRSRQAQIKHLVRRADKFTTKLGDTSSNGVGVFGLASGAKLPDQVGQAFAPALLVLRRADGDTASAKIPQEFVVCVSVDYVSCCSTQTL